MSKKKLKLERSPRQKAVLKKKFAEKVKKAAEGVFDDEPLVKDNTAGIILLQWLTYAFWGFTMLAFIWLLYIVLASMITGDNLTSMIPYAIAASVVLMPISFLCDWFYGRREPKKKKGAAMFVMVLHAVIFALFGIGMLVSAVVIVVQLLIVTPPNPGSQLVWLATFIISAFFYAYTFLRTLNPKPKMKINRRYPFVMAGVISFLILMGFLGPVAQASLTRNDRDIAAYLTEVSLAINEYTRQKEKLPDALSDVEFDGPAADLVQRDLVTYTKEGASGESKAVKSVDAYDEEQKYTFYRYLLCVTYREEDQDSGRVNYDVTQDKYYNSFPTTYGHPAGEVCYKIETSTINTEE